MIVIIIVFLAKSGDLNRVILLDYPALVVVINGKHRLNIPYFVVEVFSFSVDFAVVVLVVFSVVASVVVSRLFGFSPCL